MHSNMGDSNQERVIWKTIFLCLWYYFAATYHNIYQTAFYLPIYLSVFFVCSVFLPVKHSIHSFCLSGFRYKGQLRWGVSPKGIAASGFWALATRQIASSSAPPLVWMESHIWHYHQDNWITWILPWSDSSWIFFLGDCDILILPYLGSFLCPVGLNSSCFLTSLFDHLMTFSKDWFNNFEARFW